MFGIVIDSQGFKVEFVTLNEDKSPQFYELKEYERIVEKDWQIANSMNKPQWTGNEWIDTDPLPPVVPEPQEPNQMEVLQAQINELKIENQKLWDTCNYLINVNLDLQDVMKKLGASSVSSKARNKK